ANLQMTSSNVKWFATYQDAWMQVNELPSTRLLQTGSTYYGILVGSSGCGSLPFPVEVTVVLGNESFDLAKLNYYPNPVTDELNINYIDDIVSVEVYSITGQKIIHKQFNSKEVKVDMSSVQSGNYMIRIVTNDAVQFIK